MPTHEERSRGEHHAGISDFGPGARCEVTSASVVATAALIAQRISGDVPLVSLPSAEVCADRRALSSADARPVHA
jgi:hypothetical protein